VENKVRSSKFRAPSAQESSASGFGSKCWKAARVAVLLAGLAFLTYFQNHDPFAGLQVPHWVLVGVVGVFFTGLGVVDLRTKTSRGAYLLASREDNPGLYWLNTGIHLLFGSVALVAAIGGAVGLWSLR